MALLTDKMITDEFIADLQMMSFLPAVQSQLTHQQMLDIAYHEVLTGIAVPLTEIDHGFYRSTSNITLVADQAAYDMPEHAMLSKIHKLYLTDADENVCELTRMDPPEHQFFKGSSTSGHPSRVRVDATQIILDPPPSAADILVWPTLRTFIYRRPNRPVRLTTSGTNTGRGAVVSTAAGTLVTYTAATPSDFTASSIHDFFLGTPPFRRVRGSSPATAKAAATTQGFAAGVIDDLTAGDIGNLAGETCVMPVPTAEFLPLLHDLVIGRIARMQGDQAMYAAAQQAAQGYMAKTFPASANRLQNELAAVSLHHSPFLRGMRRGPRMVRD